jgi:Flp pilus assembly pilin Flp
VWARVGLISRRSDIFTRVRARHAECDEGSTTMKALRRRRLEKLTHDTRGAAMTEYVVLVGAVGLAVVVALVTAGPSLVKDFQRSRQMLVAPSP